jgi:ubiquinone/menaquinone biosynthesis C-methylase UbiE
VNFDLALLAGPAGSVTGVDMDADKLALARESARERGIANVGFRSGNTLVGDPRTFQVRARRQRPS